MSHRASISRFGADFFDLFATGKLDRRQWRAINEFMSAYLKLTREQYQQLQERAKTIMSPQEIQVYSGIMTESDEIAFEKGMEKGILEDSGVALLRMKTSDTLQNWLDTHS